MLFIGNIYGFQEPTEGCMYWVWAIQCDLQLHLFVPFLVMIYANYGSFIGNGCMFFLWCFSMFLNMFIVHKYDLKVGVFAIENYSLLDKVFSKPWTKLFALAIGVAFANLYMQILSYRKHNPEEKKLLFPTLHFLH